MGTRRSDPVRQPCRKSSLVAIGSGSLAIMLAAAFASMVPDAAQAQVGATPAPNLTALYGPSIAVQRVQHDYTGAQVTVTAPANALGVYFKVWGAGGGKEFLADASKAGAGGYTGALFNTVAGTQYSLVVAGGGSRAVRPGGANDPGAFGFGGSGQHDQGGGLSGVFTGTAAVTNTSTARALAVAGGGGGSDSNGNSLDSALALRSGGTNGNGALSGYGATPGTLSWNYTSPRSAGPTISGTMQGSADSWTVPADGSNCANIDMPTNWATAGGGGFQGGGRTAYTFNSGGVVGRCSTDTANSGRGGSGFVAAGNRFQSIEFTAEIAAANNNVVNQPPRTTGDTDYSAAGAPRTVPIGRAGGATGAAYNEAVNGGGDGRIIVYWIVAAPTVKVQKTTLGGVGGPFAFAATNLTGAVPAVTTTAPNTPTPAAPTALPVTAPGTAVTVTETPAAGFLQTGVTCTDANSAITGNVNPVATATTGAVTIPAAVTATAADITCVFTNAKQPILRVQKSLPLGRFVATDQFTLAIAGTGGPASVTTTGSGSTATGVATLSPGTAGASYAFSEIAAAGADLANYASAYSCTNALAGGQTPSGSGTTFNVTAAVGDDLSCTFANTRSPIADLSITKTNTPGLGSSDQPNDTLARGTVTTYTIVVTNNGPDAVTDALLRDAIAGRSGLTCTAPPTCSGAGCPVAPITLATLDSGVALGTIANGATVTVTLTCLVD